MSQQTPDVYTGTTAPGSTTMPNIKNALKALQSMNSGASAPSYAVAGTWWYDTTNEILKYYDGSVWINVFNVDTTNNKLSLLPSAFVSINTFTDGDTTPSVADGCAFKTANTSATTITNFDDGYEGQTITLHCNDNNTTIDGALTKTGMTIPLQSGDVLQFVRVGSNWQQIAGTVGMGSNYVAVDPEDEIGDWISTSTTSYTDVDVSDDGVRKGAVMVECNGRFDSSSGYIALQVRPNGSTDSNLRYVHIRISDLNTAAMWSVSLDENGKFEAKFDSSWTAGTSGNHAWVTGYWI